MHAMVKYPYFLQHDECSCLHGTLCCSWCALACMQLQSPGSLCSRIFSLHTAVWLKETPSRGHASSG